MAYSSSEQIVIIEKQIEKVKQLIAKHYLSLGVSVALFVKNKSFPYCSNELIDYEMSKKEYKKQLDIFNKLKNKVDIVDDCNKQICNLRILLDEKKEEEEKELSRFGAAVYEAYSNNKLSEDLKIKLDSIFNNINKTIAKYEKKANSTNVILFSAFYNNLLLNKKRELKKLFRNAAVYLRDNNLIEKIEILNKEKYLNTLNLAINSRTQLEKKIKKCENQIKLIKNEEAHSSSRVLEELKKDVKNAKESEINAAILLGKELYNTLPNDITSKEIGIKAISLIDNITLELAKIDSLEQDIVKIKNEMIITELSAQIAHERSKIKTLETEIANCNRQINKIEQKINEKRNKIIELKKKGTFEKSTLDLVTLDESDGNTEK